MGDRPSVKELCGLFFRSIQTGVLLMVNYEEVTSYSEGKVDDLCSTLAKKTTAVNKSTSTKKKKKTSSVPDKCVWAGEDDSYSDTE